MHSSKLKAIGQSQTQRPGVDLANPFLGKARLRLPPGVGQGVSGATEGSRLLAFPGMTPSAPLGKCLCCLGFLPLHLFWGVMPQVNSSPAEASLTR